jgi:hypothetical protein
MIGNYLEMLIASDTAQAAAEFKRLWSEEEGDPGGMEVEPGGSLRPPGSPPLVSNRSGPQLL